MVFGLRNTRLDEDNTDERDNRESDEDEPDPSELASFFRSLDVGRIVDVVGVVATLRLRTSAQIGGDASIEIRVCVFF